MSKKIRLLSLLMRSGIFKRSADASKAILSGRVKVDGVVMRTTKHSVKISSAASLDGIELKLCPLTYVVINKPEGIVCQKSQKEKTVYDIVAKIKEIDKKTRNSLFCVGRLDKDTSGLLVVTNDGNLEKLLTRKENNIVKEYEVVLKLPVSDEQIQALVNGVEIRDDDTGKVFFVKVVYARKTGENNIVIGIGEGRKRQIKKMIKEVGNEVDGLKRIGIGKIRLENIDFNRNGYKIVKKSDLRF